MASTGRPSFGLRKLAASALALVLAVTGFELAAPDQAFAQERVRRSWSLFELLAPRQPRRYVPEESVPRAEQKSRTVPKARKPSVRRQVQPEIPKVEKLADAKTVLVVGDFLGSGLADGLSAAFANDPHIRIVDRSKGSSGFVRDDFFDWPEEIKDLVAAEKPAAIVFMIGSNDRQQMKIGDAREAPRTKAWTDEYERRAETFEKSVADLKVPLVWVGMPAFKSTKMTSDMLALNDIFRAASQAPGNEFVDVWDGFVDENGAFVTTGPDLNGQPVRLRSNDGINLTASGKQKLAFYVQKPLSKILGETAMPGGAAVTPALLPGLAPDSPAAARPDRTAPISLNDPELDGGLELLGKQVQPRRDARPAAGKLTIDGVASDAEPGRADDFAWPPRRPSPAIADTPASSEKTTAISN